MIIISDFEIINDKLFNVRLEVLLKGYCKHAYFNTPQQFFTIVKFNMNLLKILKGFTYLIFPFKASFHKKGGEFNRCWTLHESYRPTVWCRICKLKY